MLAMTVDIALLYLFLTPVFFWISANIGPGSSEFSEQMYTSQLIASGLQGQAPWSQVGAELSRLKVVERLAFDYSTQLLITGLAIVLMWGYANTTPGLAMFGMFIVDAKDGSKPGIGRYIARYASTIAGMLMLMLGMFLILIDKRGQALQDKVATTVVLKGRGFGPRLVKKVSLEQERALVVAAMLAEKQAVETAEAD